MSIDERHRRVTVRDVAAVSGVTPGTVSKAISGSREVSEVTRARVLEAVARLGYRPNSIARGLRGRHTFSIGLVTDDVEGLFTTAMLRGVEEVASNRKFGVFLCNSYGHEAKERQDLEMLLDKQIDGVVLLSGYRVRERSAPALPLHGTPSVYLFQYTNDLAVPCVVPDDMMGARLATEHLIGLGRTRIGFVNGPPHFEATHDRLAGYQTALAAATIPFRPELVRVGKTWHEDQGYAQTVDLLQTHHEIDALLCASDNLAFGALDALRSTGRAVPQDISLVGFDDRPAARHQRPTLTSVALPFYEMGKMAATLILDAINGTAQEHQILRVPCQLVVRESCGGQPTTTASPSATSTSHTLRTAEHPGDSKHARVGIEE